MPASDHATWPGQLEVICGASPEVIRDFLRREDCSQGDYEITVCYGLATAPSPVGLGCFNQPSVATRTTRTRDAPRTERCGGVSFWTGPHDEPKSFQRQAKRVEVEVQQVITREDEHELWERMRLIGAT